MRILYIITLCFVLLCFITPSMAADSSGTVERIFSLDIMTPGSEFTVTLTPNPASVFSSPGWGAIETLPAGFVYVSTTADGMTYLGENQYRFVKLGAGSISYNVSASIVEDDFVFNGSFTDAERNTDSISGASIITVTTSIPSPGNVSRSFSSSSVAPNSTVTITLTPEPISLFGMPGWGVTETLPAGFVYVNTTADGMTNLGGNQYRFAKLGSNVITYTISASSIVGTYTFNGTFVDSSARVGEIAGSSDLSVFSVTIYDTNEEPGIQKDEAIKAVYDFLFNGTIEKEDAISVIYSYLFG